MGMNQCGEIVVYRNDKSIVLYNQSGQIRALPILDINLIQNESNSDNTCPFCGSVLTGDKYNYVAKAYFYMLQNSFQNFANPNNDYIYNQHSTLESENNDSTYRRSRSFNSFGSHFSPTVSKEWIENQNKEVIDNLMENEIIVNDIIETPKNIPNYLLITGYYERFFIEGNKLGSGSYGHVYNCVHILDELILGEYAVKKLPIGDDMDWLKRAIKEIKIRENIRHRNVVDYNHSWLEMYRMNELCPYIPYLFILMEYCNGGNLYNYIQSIYFPVERSSNSFNNSIKGEKHKNLRKNESNGRHGKEDYLTDNEVTVLFVDILSGLDYLHRNFIIHRDLKPSNILLKFVNNSASAIISDFGTCEIFSQKSSKSGFTGTVEYTAPELLMSSSSPESPGGPNSPSEEQFWRERYSNKVDVWSLGVVLYYMCYGNIPFYSDDIKECVKLIVESELRIPNYPKRSKLILSLITNLLSKNPNNRMDCNNILNIHEINKFLINDEFNQQIRYSLYQRYKEHLE